MRKNAVVSLAAVLAIGMGIAAGRAEAQIRPDAPERTIEVMGVGEVRVMPDEARISFAVETFAETAEAAGRQNAEIMDRVIAALVAAGVPRDHLETQNYSLHPEYVHDEGTREPRLRGYRATNQMELTTRELDRVGPLIDVALAAGANRMNGVSFTVSDADAATERALTQAVERARSAAQAMAAALGVRLGPVVRASTSTAPPPPVTRMERMDMAVAAAPPPTPISPGEQSVRASVSLAFAIEG